MVSLLKIDQFAIAYKMSNTMKIAEELREISVASNDKIVEEFRNSSQYKNLIDLARADAERGANHRVFRLDTLGAVSQSAVKAALNLDGFEVIFTRDYFSIGWGEPDLNLPPTSTIK